MALRPMGKGQKHKTSYSDAAWVPDNMTVKGPDNKKASMSQATTTTIQGCEGMMLWSGTRVEQKRITDIIGTDNRGIRRGNGQVTRSKDESQGGQH
jgi:hypothetical protein